MVYFFVVSAFCLFLTGCIAVLLYIYAVYGQFVLVFVRLSIVCILKVEKLLQQLQASKSILALCKVPGLACNKISGLGAKLENT